MQNETSEHTFKFDHVFPQYTDQETMYSRVARPLLSSVLNGINGAILAYGQTGSGKTYTMQVRTSAWWRAQNKPQEERRQLTLLRLCVWTGSRRQHRPR